MKTWEVKLPLPDNISEDELKLMLALKLYETHKLSLGQAARLSGFSKRAFIEILGRYQIPVFDYSPQELKDEAGL